MVTTGKTRKYGHHYDVTISISTYPLYIDNTYRISLKNINRH